MSDVTPPEATVYEDVLARWRRGRARVYAVLWSTYAAFYLCRANLSPAKSTLEAAVGLNKAQQGRLDFLFKGGYAAGQWLGGVLGDKFGGRVMLATGAMGGALMCAGFGFCKSFWGFALFWLLNGVVQSIAWPGVSKCFANWFPPRLRGKLHGLLCSSYMLGPAVTLLVTGAILDHLDWQYAFWIPAGVLFAFGLAAAAWADESPQKAGLPALERLERLDRNAKNGDVEEETPAENDEDSHDHHLGFRYTLRRTLANPRIWCAGLAFLCVDIARHGTFDWLPRYFSELHPNMRITDVAWRTWTIPLGGAFGAAIAGWSTDRLFGSRRVPTVCMLLAAVGALSLAWARHAELLAPYAPAYLAMLGFCMYAAQALIVGPLAMDLATRKAAASASGIIGTIGYGGAAIMAAVSGEILERYETMGRAMVGWHVLFYIWAAAAFLGVVCLLPLWKFRPGEGEYY